MNLSRLRYLLNLYKISNKDLLERASEGLQNKLTEDEVFTSLIDISRLKKIDAVFKKGLSFYTDPAPPPPTKESSIFFRKQDFTGELNFASKRLINDVESFKLSFYATAKAIKLDLKRILPSITIKQSPQLASEKYRQEIVKEFNADEKIFLTSLINNLAKYNILVVEFIENWNQKEFANIDGAFISPNIIVLKRQAGKHFRREIFTLIHEFGHYLLGKEEAEKVSEDVFANKSLNKIENWCNDFAFSFLIYGFEDEFMKLPFANETNDYHHSYIEYLSSKTHLSQTALYTKLLMAKKISATAYRNIKRAADRIFLRELAEEKRKREEEKEKNPQLGGGRPKPINSELLVNAVQSAFKEGVLSEYEMIKALKHRIR